MNSDLLVNETEKSNEDVIIDLSYLKSFSNDDKEFEEDLLKSSLTDVEQKMEELQKSVLLKDGRKIMQTAHSLKSVSAIIGINVLYEQFKAIEISHLEKGYSSDTELQISNVSALWQRAKIKLEALIAEYS